MSLFDLYKELYYKENENKSRLGAKLIPMLTILVALTTAEVWVINNLLSLNFENCTLTMITYFLLISSAIGNIAIFFFFYRAHYNYKHKYIKVSDIEEYDKKLHSEIYINYYTPKELNTILKNSIKDMYYDATVNNQSENNRKIKNQRALMTAYLIQLVILIACFCWITFN